jgi:serine/threonine-protein kinase
MEPGSKLGSYVVVSAIGEGGKGKVYKAHDPRLDRHTAIKVLPQEVSTDPTVGATFHLMTFSLRDGAQHHNVIGGTSIQ